MWESGKQVQGNNGLQMDQQEAKTGKKQENIQKKQTPTGGKLH